MNACTKCGGELKQLFTSWYCPRCHVAPGSRGGIPEKVDGMRCAYRSSVTGLQCLLEEGHPCYSPTRFHKFDSKELKPPRGGAIHEYSTDGDMLLAAVSMPWRKFSQIDMYAYSGVEGECSLICEVEVDEKMATCILDDRSLTIYWYGDDGELDRGESYSLKRDPKW